MSHAFKFCVIAISAVLIGDRALAQCFVCSDSSSNTAIGTSALFSGTNNGPNNTAVGYKALYSNTAGKGNDAQGVNALYSNTTGIRNLAIGSNALYANTTGSYSVALGFDAGYDQTTGNDDIYINNVGVGGESQTLRLGTTGTPGVIGSGILTAYIAGVATSQVTGGAVYVTSSGQLGVLASSERFKMEVETMQEASDKLAQLRPVTFKLKTDPKGAVQYGLIAEEVAKVYPELVIHGAGGGIDGVRYEELAPMLLYEVQQQRHQLRDMQRQMVEMRATLVKLRAQDQLVALR
jgi:trimeric autotransporter adhesin